MSQEQTRNLKATLCKAEIVPRAARAEQKCFVLCWRGWGARLQWVVCFILNSLPVCGAVNYIIFTSYFKVALRYQAWKMLNTFGWEKNSNKQLRQIFHPSAASVHPSLPGPHCLVRLLQKELVAFSILTCCVAPLMSPPRAWSLLSVGEVCC